MSDGEESTATATEVVLSEARAVETKDDVEVRSHRLPFDRVPAYPRTQAAWTGSAGTRVRRLWRQASLAGCCTGGCRATAAATALAVFNPRTGIAPPAHSRQLPAQTADHGSLL